MNFKAKIHGTFAMSTIINEPINTTLTFTKYRIMVKPDQKGKLYLDPYQVLEVVDKMEYEFTKLLNKEDKRMFSIIRKQKLNQLDNGVQHLNINLWNKVKANIIHRRYWIQKNSDWFLKTILAVLIGAIVGVAFNERGYQRGFQEGLKYIQSQPPDTLQK